MIARLAFIAAVAVLGQPASAQTAPPLADALVSDANVRLVDRMMKLVEDVCVPIASNGTIPLAGGAAWRTTNGVTPMSPARVAAALAELNAEDEASFAGTATGFDSQLGVMVFPGPRCRILLRRTPQARAAEMGLMIDLSQSPLWRQVRQRDGEALFVRNEAVPAKRVAAIQRVSDAAGADEALQLMITVAVIPEAVLKAVPTDKD